MSYSPNRPNKELTLYRQFTAWELHALHKWTQIKIAAHLGISQAAVSKLIKKNNQEYIRRLHSGEAKWP